MARKLSEDQIRWILDLDAKGVQGTLAQVSSSTLNLQKANRQLSEAIRATEKEIAEMEKQLLSLEKAGKKNSAEYKNLSQQILDSRQSNADFRREIAQNEKTIAENNKKFVQLEQSLALSDMTMEQLRRRAESLRKQLDVTSRSASPEAYQTISEELNLTKQAMAELSSSGNSLADILDNIPGPAGGAVKSVKSLSTALKALIANPIGIAIMAVVTALQLLKTVIDTNASASNTFNGAMAALSSILDSSKRIVTDLFAAFYNLITLDWDALKNNLNAIAGNTSALLDNASAAYQAAEAEYNLNLQLQDNSAVMQTNQAEIERLRTISQDVTLSYNQRAQALQQLSQLEEQNYDLALNNITETYNLWKQKNANVVTEIQNSSAAQFQAVEAYIEAIQAGTQLSFEQQTQLNDYVSHIAHNLRNTSTEVRDEFRAIFTDLSTQQQEYYRKSREDANREASIRKATAEKNFNDALKQIDNAEKRAIYSISNDLNSLLVTEKQLAVDTLDIQRSFLQQKRELYIRYNQDTIDIDKQLLDNQNKLNEARFNNEIDVAHYHFVKQHQQLQQQLLARNITQEQFDNSYNQILQQYYDTAAALGQKYNHNTTELLSFSLSLRLRMQEQYATNTLRTAANTREALIAATQAACDTEVNALQRQFDQKEIGQREFDRRMLALRLKTAQASHDILLDHEKALSVMVDNKIPGAAQALQDLQRDIATSQAELERIAAETAQNGINTFTLLSDAFDNLETPDFFQRITQAASLMFEQLDSLLNDNSRSWNDYAASILHCISASLSAITDITKQLFENETATLQAEKEKQLSIAGDNAQAREAVEQQFAQKELDLKKRQASADAAIQSAQLWIDTALGVVSAWTSCMKLGPIAGPIAAGILSAALLSMATLQQDTILKNRDAILNTSLYNASATSSSDTSLPPAIGSISLKEGYADGGYTGNGAKYEVAGYLPDGSPFHRGEYFVAQEEMANPSVVPLVRAIEAVRRKRTALNPLPLNYGNHDGFAEGGFHNSGNDLTLILQSIQNTLRALQENPIKATLNYYTFEDTAQKVADYRKHVTKQ